MYVLSIYGTFIKKKKKAVDKYSSVLELHHSYSLI